RLLFLLQETLRERADSDWQIQGKPEIYVIVNNIADLYIQNPDQAHELGRFIRSGGSVGIHLIITSNRVSELPRALSGNISNRIVLQLADNQEFLDVLGRRMPELTLRTPGRGYLVREGEVAECQVTIPDSNLIIGADVENLEPGQKPLERDLDIQLVTRNICALSTAMQSHWTGEQAKPVSAMSDILTLKSFEKILNQTTRPQIGVSIPIGLDYQRLSPLYSDLRRDGPFWTILGGRQNGKSNFLLSMIYHLDKDYPNKVQMTLIPFRRGPLSRIEDTPNRHLIMGADQIIETLNKTSEAIQNQPDTMHFVFMDDLGIAYSSGNSALVSALNQLGDQLNILGQDNFMVVIADLYSNLKTSQTYNSSFLKLFQQSQAGIFFSKDDNDAQWFNTPISLQQKKSLKLLPGRGFFVSQGKAEFIQSPLLDITEIG
ncbi:MAG: hypothetical protein H0S82_08225, partial [Anaerolineaceae bacterium]|nr:hypothetical protein [Anaerolineaceae bacterium]